MHPLTLLILTLTLTLSFFHGYSQPQPLNDAISLLSFKSKADPDNHLVFSPQQDYCEWQGVKCHHSRVVRFYLRNLPLGGTFPPNSLTSLPHLRVLVLSNTSLSGPLPPSLHSLPNLRSLLLPHNSFSSSLPPSLFSLSHLRILDLSFNLLSSSLSSRFLDLPHLTSLQLQFNRFHGTLPLFNQSSLLLFNVSANNLSGRVPPTSTLSHFPASSFAFNPFLCGELVNKPCHSPSPFFASSSSSSSADQPPNSTVSSNNHDDSASLISPPHSKLHRKRRIMILGFSLGGLLLASSSLVLCVFIAAKKKKTTKNEDGNHSAVTSEVNSTERQGEVNRVRLDSQSKEFVPGGGGQRGGDLVFCAGEVKLYTLEQLMRGSAEMLGRGMTGTTYKAKLDNQLILTVKRLDATRMSGVDADMFERHMQAIGAMRHPNLVSVRAYFQAKEERLIIFDYQPNGSVFNLIHGSRSTRAKPLHWTSCLKIAEDVAEGLAYIHQASKLAHGNLKASNVLLGTEFEACVTDYCLSALSASSSCDNEDPDSARYRAPEARNSAWNATSKMDVYAFGVLLLELLSGKAPSQHPFLAPQDMLDWVKSMRGDDDSCEDNNLAMLAEVASLCSLISPEQRPQMWEVLKMIQKIKATVGSGDAINPTTGYS